MRQRFRLIAACMFLFFPLFGQPRMSAEFSLEPITGKVDTPAYVTVSVNAPAGYTLDTDSLIQQMLSAINFAVQEIKVEEVEVLSQKAVYRLFPRTEGTFYLNLFSIPITDGKERLELPGNILRFQVEVAGEDREALKYTDGIVEPRIGPLLQLSPKNAFGLLHGQHRLRMFAEKNSGLFLNLRPVFWVLTAILLLAGVGYLYGAETAAFIRSLPFPKRKPQEKALRRIGRLPVDDADSGAIVGNIVREYFSDTIDPSLKYRTSAEIIKLLRGSRKYGEEPLRNLSRVFHEADLIKFSGCPADPEKVRQISGMAERLIRRF